MSVLEYNRENARQQRTTKAFPRFVSVHDDLAGHVEGEERFQSKEAAVLRVKNLLDRIHLKEERELLTLFLQEDGNVAAVARMVGCKENALRYRFKRLFRRIEKAGECGEISNPACIPAWIFNWLVGRTVLPWRVLKPGEDELLKAARIEGGNIAAAARRLKIDHATAYRRLRRIIARAIPCVKERSAALSCNE